jgi:hypothetical protein
MTQKRYLSTLYARAILFVITGTYDRLGDMLSTVATVIRLNEQ